MRVTHIEWTWKGVPPPGLRARVAWLPCSCMPGSQIGAYKLDSLLGSGAYGVVWLAHRNDNGDRCAIKVLHPEAAIVA